MTAPPRFRERPRQRNGQVTIYYFWDGRGRGMSEIALGTDRDLALQRYAKCEQGIFSESDREARKLQSARQAGIRRKINAEDWIAAEAWARTMYFNAERRAALSGKPFTITPGDLLDLIRRADGKCQVSGLPLETGGSRLPFAPSLDRIDCAKGYEAGNVRIVCHILNIAMNTWGLPPVLKLVHALKDHP